MNQPRPWAQIIGNDGNAYAIIGKCRRALQGASPKYVQEFQDEATSGDYDNVLTTAMKYCEVE